jgi:chromodomain-helicase-DNA-binding protein 3/chromodomain-helicase-DNA-binding protein 4
VVYGFSAFHRIDFLEFLLKFGVEFDSIEQLAILYNQSYIYVGHSRLSAEKPSTFKGDVRPQNDEIKKYLKEFYAILLDFESFLHKDNIVFCGLNVIS